MATRSFFTALVAAAAAFFSDTGPIRWVGIAVVVAGCAFGVYCIVAAIRADRAYLAEVTRLTAEEDAEKADGDSGDSSH